MEVEAVGRVYGTPAPGLPPTPTPAAGASEKDGEAVARVRILKETAEARADAVATALEQAKVDREQLRAILEKLNIVMNALDIQAKFSIHETTRQVMIRVVNVESGKLIREIPPEHILDLAAKMMELVGVLLDERV
jgi:flagellar protein FlaG